MKIRHWLLAILGSGLVFAAVVFVSGCGLPKGPPAPEQARPPQPEAGNKPVAVYHDFEDVLVPKELAIVKDRTLIVLTPGFRSGILTLKGRVDSSSLYNFFSMSMEKDNWDVISSFKAPDTTIMVFQKATRCAVVSIREKQIYTYVEISVAPTLNGVSRNPVNDGTF